MNKRIWAVLCPAVLVLAAVVLAFGSPSAAGRPSGQTTQATQKSILKPTELSPLLKPDLAINEIWFAQWVENPNVSPIVPIKTSLKLGVKVMMVCDLVNQGNRDITSLWLLGYYIDNVMVWNNSWGNLAAGKTLRGFGPYTPTTEGTHNFRCVVDVNNQIAESHEDNNMKEVLFMVVK